VRRRCGPTLGAPCPRGLDLRSWSWSCGWAREKLSLGYIDVGSAAQAWDEGVAPTSVRNILAAMEGLHPRGGEGREGEFIAPRPAGGVLCRRLLHGTRRSANQEVYSPVPHEMSGRWCWLGGVSPHPNQGVRVGAKQARNLPTALGERDRPDQVPRCAIGMKVGGAASTTAFRADGVQLLKTPVGLLRKTVLRSAWVRSVRTECGRDS